MKGQVTMTNLLALFITVLLYTQLAPMMNDAILPTVAYFQANPSPISSPMIFLLYCIPFVVLLAIILTAFNYAVPQRETYQGGRN